MSMSNSFSNAMTSSTVSRLSAPRSSMKLASVVSFSRSTPSSSPMMSLTLSSTLLMASSEGGWCNSDRHAAVNCQDLPGNVPGEIGCEKEHRSRNVFRASGPAKGDAAKHRGLGLVGQGAGHVRLDESWGNRIDQDVAAGVLLGHRFSEPDEPRLAGRIVGLSLVARNTHNARDVDD